MSHVVVSHPSRAAEPQTPQANSETCPPVSNMALAAVGQLSPEQQQEIAQHVAGCRKCAEARNQLIERLSAWGGRYLYKGHLKWTVDWSWTDEYKKYLVPDAVNGQPKTRIIDRRFTLIQLAGAVAGLRGSTAECGVLGGVGSAMICKTLESTYADGELHWGFDSFEGLSEPEPVDLNQYSWQTKGALAISPEVAKQNLSDFPFCALVKGWIPECFAPAEESRFRLVHIDLDLCQPTIDSLNFFYPRMHSGGVFVMDDYGHMTCRGVRKAVDEFFAEKPEIVIESVDGIAYVFKK